MYVFVKRNDPSVSILEHHETYLEFTLYISIVPSLQSDNHTVNNSTYKSTFDHNKAFRKEQRLL